MYCSNDKYIKYLKYLVLQMPLSKEDHKTLHQKCWYRTTVCNATYALNPKGNYSEAPQCFRATEGLKKCAKEMLSKYTDSADEQQIMDMCNESNRNTYYMRK